MQSWNGMDQSDYLRWKSETVMFDDWIDIDCDACAQHRTLNRSNKFINIYIQNRR